MVFILLCIIIAAAFIEFNMYIYNRYNTIPDTIVDNIDIHKEKDINYTCNPINIPKINKYLGTDDHVIRLESSTDNESYDSYLKYINDNPDGSNPPFIKRHMDTKEPKGYSCAAKFGNDTVYYIRDIKFSPNEIDDDQNIIGDVTSMKNWYNDHTREGLWREWDSNT
jgi:hypothetical protein